MDNYRISKNYAKALFLLATEMGQQAEVANDMRLVHEVFSENHQLHVIFGNPVIKQGKKVAIIEDLFSSRITKLTDTFIHFVVRKNRAVNMRGISEMYIDMDRESRGVVLVEMATSYAVDADVLTTVGEMVAHVTGKDVEVQSNVDPSIIGGFVVKFDNNMYDARIRTQLDSLRKYFSENEYESKL
ncbi:MAG: ATP synthase F1 subunit delta [Bacteroidales bacterium]|nr:ATP synthase F1 subunit delta [Bacteroidales bacterium]